MKYVYVTFGSVSLILKTKLWRSEIVDVNEDLCWTRRGKWCSVKKGVLENFANFTGNHLCWSLILTKLQALRCFPVKFAIILRTSILKNICERLLLYFIWNHCFQQSNSLNLKKTSNIFWMYYLFVFYMHQNVALFIQNLLGKRA